MNSMDENLAGYLLGALDEPTRRQVEAYLRSHPVARSRLHRLREAMEPLRADPDSPPPRGLAERTLARIASRRRPVLPMAPRVRSDGGGGSGWPRRSELLVASILAFVISGLVVVYFGRGQRAYADEACKENLHALYSNSLTVYSDGRADHAFPRIEAEGPRSAAGMFVPILSEVGAVPSAANLSCPSSGERAVSVSVDTLRQMEEWYRTDRVRYLQTARELAGCYAYSLGYREGDALFGLRAGAGNDLVPLLADRPPLMARDEVTPGNSPNHAGRGQNILFVDGSVRFVTTRTVGMNGDDIYLNQKSRVLAGVHASDYVLGAGDASP